MPLDKMAAIAYPGGIPSSGHLYIFREAWNPSGTRFITFIEDSQNNLFEGYSMASTASSIYSCFIGRQNGLCRLPS